MSLSRLLALFGHRDQKGLNSYLRDCNISLLYLMSIHGHLLHYCTVLLYVVKVLEYLEYRNFLPVIKKAKEVCVNSQYKVQDHFEDMHEMVEIGKGVKPLKSLAERCPKTCQWLIA